MLCSRGPNVYVIHGISFSTSELTSFPRLPPITMSFSTSESPVAEMHIPSNFPPCLASVISSTEY